jgi:hypothetical protein
MLYGKLSIFTIWIFCTFGFLIIRNFITLEIFIWNFSISNFDLYEKFDNLEH